MATAEPEINFEYIAAVREPDPDGVTAVTYRVKPPSGWKLEKVVVNGRVVTVGVLPWEVQRKEPGVQLMTADQ